MDWWVRVRVNALSAAASSLMILTDHTIRLVWMVLMVLSYPSLLLLGEPPRGSFSVISGTDLDSVAYFTSV